MSEPVNAFSALPERLAAGLSLGSVGKFHLLALAREAFSHAGNEALGSELALAAWEADPLDGDLAAQLEGAGVDASVAAPRILQVVDAVKKNWHRPGNLEYFQRLLQKRNTEKILQYLRAQHDKDPHNIYWLQQALGFAVYEGAYDWLVAWLGHGAYPEALEKKIRGDLAFCTGAYAAAAEQYQQAYQAGGLFLARVRYMESLHRLGETDSALAFGCRILEERPWQTNLLLVLHDRITGLAGAKAALPGRVAVLLYTYNKADELERTLDALMPELPANATVFVLDNGSQDATPALLAGWRQRFSGPDVETRFQDVRLPVNIGAPAARNWLVAMPQTRAYEWLAFLDDDAAPPAGWLESLGQAVSASPRAGVWGCRVVDAHNPMILQSVDTHLTDPQDTPTDGMLPAYHRSFGFSKLQHQDLDFGQFDYLRPCASVTGCCHLFRRATLEQSRGFDLCFTPSQYDDVEHDLRLGMEGRPVMYHGHLRVAHSKRTGRLGRHDPQELARALGNLYKLQTKFDTEQIAQLRRQSAEVLRADLLAKAERLRQNGMQLAFWA